MEKQTAKNNITLWKLWLLNIKDKPIPDYL